MANTVLLLAAAIVSTSSAHAAVLASTFGPGDSFSAAPGFVVGNAIFQQQVAVTFRPQIAATLVAIRVAAAFDLGVNEFDIYIAPDESGMPGSPLELFSGLSFPSPAGVLSLNSKLHPLLLPASTYWIVMSASDPFSSEGAWNWNNQGFEGVFARNSISQFNWVFDPSPTPAFAVSGTVAAPEPSTWILAAAGLALVTVRLRRRPSSNRIDTL